MTNPIIVDTIENNFIPLLIHNNSGGEDSKILKKYKEPAWNYQVIRFLNANSQDIIPRKDRVNTQKQLSARMALALEKAGKPVPKALQLLQLEKDTTQLEQVAFSCHCFWTGEHKLGAIDGVIATEAGWLAGHEVTLVTYHKIKLPLKELISLARQKQVANDVYLSSESQRKRVPLLVKKTKSLKGYRKAKKSDQKRQIPGTIFTSLFTNQKLSDSQACKVNAFCRSNPQKALEYLTSSQRHSIGK